jgi:hypothetical protein
MIKAAAVHAALQHFESLLKQQRRGKITIWERRIFII